MAGLQRRQDAFGARELVERGQRLVVGDADVFGTAGVLEERVFRADAGIVEAGGDRMRLDDLAVVVAQHVGAVAVQHAGAARGQRCGVVPGRDALARRFGADDAHVAVVEERMEDADRVAAAADAGGDRVRKAAVFGQHLRARLAADDGVEVADHARVRIGAGDGADDVERVLHVGDPVAHRFVQGILERGRAAGHRHHGRAEQLHAVDVDLLPLDVGRAHVHDAFETQARGHRRRLATPCWPAPVSAMIRVLPIRDASSAWPMVLLILCAPVWFRSSRLSRMRAPPTSSLRRCAW